MVLKSHRHDIIYVVVNRTYTEIFKQLKLKLDKSEYREIFCGNGNYYVLAKDIMFLSLESILNREVLTTSFSI